MDLGECPKIHDLALRADYEKASHSKDYYYDIDVSSHCCIILSSAFFYIAAMIVKTNEAGEGRGLIRTSR
jgi:hypothetical protein